MRAASDAGFGMFLQDAKPRNSQLFSGSLHFSLDTCVCLVYIRSMKRVSMFLSEVQIAALKKLSKRTGIKASELIRRFIDKGLKKV